jgi:hypothetical protein
MLEQNQRKCERWTLMDIYLAVFLDESTSPLGHIKDIHTHGIRLVSKKAIMKNEEMKVNIESSLDAWKQPRVSPFKVRCAWSKADSRGHLFESGFEIIPPGVPQRIENIINDVKGLEIELREIVQEKLFDTLKHYKDALDKFKTSISVSNKNGTRSYAYEVLRRRDEIQELLDGNDQYPGVVVPTIVKLDLDLKKQAAKIAREIDLSDCRASLHPGVQRWWWFFDQGSNWFWSLLAILFIYLTFAGMVYILPRFFKGGPDLWGALYSVLIVALALPGAAGALQSLPHTI